MWKLELLQRIESSEDDFLSLSLSLFDFGEEFRVPLVLCLPQGSASQGFGGRFRCLVLKTWHIKEWWISGKLQLCWKIYFNTKHLPPKTGIFLKETVFTPSFLRFHVSNFHWLPHGSHPRSISRDPGHDRNCAGSQPQNRERHCIWFSYPLELPGIIRSYESYVIFSEKTARRPFSIHPLWLRTWRNSRIWESHISFKKKGIVELFFVQPVKSTPHCSWLSLDKSALIFPVSQNQWNIHWIPNASILPEPLMIPQYFWPRLRTSMILHGKMWVSSSL